MPHVITSSVTVPRRSASCRPAFLTDSHGASAPGISRPDDDTTRQRDRFGNGNSFEIDDGMDRQARRR
jgi:hypothetical protein